MVGVGSDCCLVVFCFDSRGLVYYLFSRVCGFVVVSLFVLVCVLRCVGACGLIVLL